MIEIMELPKQQPEPPKFWVEYRPIDSVFCWWVFEKEDPHKPIGKFASEGMARHAVEVLMVC